MMNKKKSNYTKFNRIIDKNIDEVRNFILTRIPDCKSRTKYKIDTVCPFCDDGRRRKKFVINLDWQNAYCFRCGKHLSLFKYFKELNLDNDFFDLLQSLSNLSLYDLQTILKSNTAKVETETEEVIDDDAELAKEFITKNGLFSIEKMNIAKKYALSRVYNNENEIESYMADDKYVYVPIVVNNTVVAYMGRLYIGSDNNNFPRYNMKTLRTDIPAIGFFDEVSSNISTNSIYLTEGYWDAYAINYAMSNYVSMCMFGKGKIKNVIEYISGAFSRGTNIYITLDSKNKDKKIVENILDVGDCVVQYFPNTYVVELSNEDPNDVLNNYGSLALKEDLERKITPFVRFKLKERMKI